VFSRHLRIPEHKVRVIAPDIGGGFGMKLNVYSDEIATVVASKLVGRPVKLCVDRLESFVSDAQARDHRIKIRIAVNKSGEIAAMEMDDIGAVGAYGMPMRFNVAEGMMAITIMGAPYSFESYKARTRSVYVNKNLIGMYRGVGMPFACSSASTPSSSNGAPTGRKAPCPASRRAARSSRPCRFTSAWTRSSG
jgi:carbon-monoxide dehydrogenase large subunit